MRKALVAFAMAALLIGAAGAQAAKDSVRIGMGLEPPGLDPTAEAAAAVLAATALTVAAFRLPSRS